MVLCTRMLLASTRLLDITDSAMYSGIELGVDQVSLLYNVNNSSIT